MADRWELFKKFFGTEDDDSPITDASDANDFMVEDAIIQFQETSKKVTDIAVALSAARAEVDDTLLRFRESVTLAYTAALSGNISEVKNILAKVVDL